MINNDSDALEEYHYHLKRSGKKIRGAKFFLDEEKQKIVIKKSLNVALLVFQQIKKDKHKPTLDSYNLMIEVAKTADRLDLAHEVLGWMDEEKVRPNVITYKSLLRCAGNAKNFEMANLYLKRMQEDDGCEPDYVAKNLWVDAAIKTNNIDAAMKGFIDLGLRVKIHKLEYEKREIDAIDFHGYSHGAACAAVAIYLKNTEGVSRFMCIPGHGVHSGNMYAMKNFVQDFIKNHLPQCEIPKVQPRNLGRFIVEIKTV